jgi:hypothetical protein
VTSSREMSLRLTLWTMGSFESVLTKLRISSTERKSSLACSRVIGACGAEPLGVGRFVGACPCRRGLKQPVAMRTIAVCHMLDLLPVAMRCCPNEMPPC